MTAGKHYPAAGKAEIVKPVFHDPMAKWPDDPILDGPMKR
jgi:hypothetical protein